MLKRRADRRDTLLLNDTEQAEMPLREPSRTNLGITSVNQGSVQWVGGSDQTLATVEREHSSRHMGIRQEKTHGSRRVFRVSDPLSGEGLCDVVVPLSTLRLIHA